MKLADAAGQPIEILPENIHGAVITTQPAVQYTLTMAVIGSGTTTPAVGVHTYAAKRVVDITATPAAGWQFVNWTGDVATVANVNVASTTITMNGDYSITAKFSPEGERVDISIQPPTKSVMVGQTFTFDIRADAGTQPVTGVAAFVNFDASKLEVLRIIPGTALPMVLQNIFDNTAGAIDYNAGQLTAPFPRGTFVVATIEFMAREETPATPVEFNQTAPRKTMADFGGTDVTGVITGATVEIAVGAPIFLDPPSTTVHTGQTFTLEIKTDVADLQPVTGVSAFINFDASKLKVLSITPGTALPTVLQNIFDNTVGAIDYSAGQLTAPFPRGTFVVATIEFMTLAETPSTLIEFSFAAPRKTMVDFGGVPILGTHGDAAVEIIPGATVDISVVLQGGMRPDPKGWEVPITIKFFAPGADVLKDTPIAKFNTMTAKAEGRAISSVTGIIPDTYDITVVSQHTLMNLKRNVVISLPGTAVDMGTLLEGNANDDKIINISDFGILALSFMKTEGYEAFDERADFDRNGIVNISDFGLLAVNFMKTSPVEIP
ncbi:MAG: hypothetical protein DDT25_00617 [Chloroflexi bacterium]|nr:hypothetical protein [Chloroflexota bacterium]